MSWRGGIGDLSLRNRVARMFSPSAPSRGAFAGAGVRRGQVSYGVGIGYVSVMTGRR